jgi:hypothetical protein
VLTSNGSDLGKMHRMKAVNDFDTFPASIIMPSSNKWSRSNDLWKSGVLLGLPVSGQISEADSFLGLSLHPSRN